MIKRIEWAGLTHVGLVRSHNEDNFFIDAKAQTAFVADGMGGHAAGDVASALAVEVMRQAVEDSEDLSAGLIRAHRAILSHPKGGGHRGMGTTGVALRIQDREAEVAWVGDSRAYLWQNQALLPLSKDHTPVQAMVDRGVITEEQARTHHQRNEIEQALGAAYADVVYPSKSRAWIDSGDVILLCSDGLTEHLSDDRIAQLLAAGTRNIQATAERLVEAALDDGGSDNITVVLAKPTAF